MQSSEYASRGRNFVGALLRFATFTNKFRSVKRLVWYRTRKGRRRENNGEHVTQLMFFAWMVDSHLRLGHNMKRVFEYILVHDLPETYAQDTPAFPDPKGNGRALASSKVSRELKAIERIASEWRSAFPSLVSALEAYRAQSDRESRFVYALDKILPILNVVDDEGWSWRRLDVNLESLDLYKRSRIATHPEVAHLYEQIFTFLRKRPELFCELKAGR